MRIVAAIGLFTLSITLPAAAQTVAPAPDALKIYNFGKVNDGYFRGAQPTGNDYAALAALGVKTVVNLTNDEDGEAGERELVEQHGMRYVSIPMTTRRPPTKAQIAAFLAAVDEEGAVYVHCVGGRHRTGVMTAVYRMTRDGLSGAQAFQEMKQFKYGPDFLHPEFKKFVHSYQPKAAAAAASQQQQQQ
jgi:protein tyrosine/serine phosphatase